MFVRSLTRISFPSIAIGLILSWSALAADPNKRHPHHGMIKPYIGAPPLVDLTPKEQQQVDEGKPVYKQVEFDGGGRAVAVFLVDAKPKAIWGVISNFEKYPEWIPSLAKTKIYKKDGDNIGVEFTISAFFQNFTYYVSHNYPMEKSGWGTWKLDYSKQSDFDDLVGFWRVESAKSNPEKSVVYYSVELKIKSWIPSAIKNLVVDKGLKEATHWVKVQSESASLAAKRQTS